MLVPFLLDSEVDPVDRSWPPAQLVQAHKDFLKVWGLIGLLIHNGEKFEDSSLRKMIDELPSEVRGYWLELIKQNRVAYVSALNKNWSGVVADSNYSASGFVSHLAVVDDVKAEVIFGLTENELSKFISSQKDCEVSRFFALNHSKVIEDAIDLSQTHINKKIHHKVIWDERFHFLCIPRNITQVAIFDRFSISQHVLSKNNESALLRFSNYLNESSQSKKNLTIIASWTADLDKYKKENELDSEGVLNIIKNDFLKFYTDLPQKKIRSIDIHVLPSRLFRDGGDGHDRHVRFENYVWDLGNGIDFLSGPSVSRARTSATFKSGKCISEYKEKEFELVHKRDKHHFVIQINSSGAFVKKIM